MIAKGGARLLEDDAASALVSDLLPLATVITPNIPEAEVILGYSIETIDDMIRAAKELVNLGAKSAVVKGGHLVGEPVDIFYDGLEIYTSGNKESKLGILMELGVPLLPV